MADSSSPDDSAELIARWRNGDQQAAQEIFHRYLVRLTALARSRLSPKMGRRIDADDLVQSVYRSFFRVSSDDSDFALRGADLWGLLAAMMIHKVKNQVRHHTAKKRSVGNEAEFALEGTAFRLAPAAITAEPTPDEALALSDELEAVMQALEPVHRAILQFRLQGMPVDEISLQIGRSERTVRRILQGVREELSDRLLGSVQSGGA